MMHWPKLILLSLMCSSFLAPESNTIRTLKYKILKEGKPIGEVIAVRTLSGDEAEYDVETHMNLKLIINQKVDYTSKASFRNGILQNSVSRAFLNDRPHQSCTTKLRTGGYQVLLDHQEYFLKRQVSYSGTMLYFKEPSNVTLVYSEMSGQDNKMTHQGEGYYVLTNSRNRKQNQYWYKSGILDHAAINSSLVDIEIQRVY